MNWWNKAECQGMPTHWFFPAEGSPKTVVMKACRKCSVADECLNDALSIGSEYDFGIRAGISARARRRLRAQIKNPRTPDSEIVVHRPVELRWDSATQRFMTVRENQTVTS